MGLTGLVSRIGRTFARGVVTKGTACHTVTSPPNSSDLGTQEGQEIDMAASHCGEVGQDRSTLFGIA
jgi:hypothetical protein